MNLLTTNKIEKEEDDRWSSESQSTEEGRVLTEQGNISSNMSLSPYQSIAWDVRHILLIIEGNFMFSMQLKTE